MILPPGFPTLPSYYYRLPFGRGPSAASNSPAATILIQRPSSAQRSPSAPGQLQHQAATPAEFPEASPSLTGPLEPGR